MYEKRQFLVKSGYQKCNKISYAKITFLYCDLKVLQCTQSKEPNSVATSCCHNSNFCKLSVRTRYSTGLEEVPTMNFFILTHQMCDKLNSWSQTGLLAYCSSHIYRFLSEISIFQCNDFMKIRLIDFLSIYQLLEHL